MFDFTPMAPHYINNNGDKLIYPFGPPIFQTIVPEDIVSRLITEGKSLNRIDDDNNFHLAGNLKYGRSLKYHDDFKEELEPFIISKAEEFISMLNSNGHPTDKWIGMELADLWINFSQTHDFNPTHIHFGDISFVIYCDVPQHIFFEQADSNFQHAGKIVFEYSDSIFDFMNDSWMVEPFNGLMFMFPSRLKHFVPAFWVDALRVSVAGNIVANKLEDGNYKTMMG